ncbi:MAG: DUF418 domain-containing protein [Bacteroidales bacterium]|nr:DUF418 domain-containing protein [Bacteroidales bacterium]
MQKPRLEVVDALRGFAVAAIMLLHNIEHFDLYYFPESLPEWIKTLDGAIWSSVFFLFGGKAFALFALLFGLTFFIQSDNQAKKGKGFSGRFAWRMTLLLLFGLINSVFYQGDILSIYAILGFFLIPLSRLSNKQLLAVSVILLLQPIEIYKLIEALLHPGLPVSDPASWAYFGQMGSYLMNSSFLDAAKGNLTNGKWAVLLWNFENGRYFIILALFLLGMLAGRKGVFTPNTKNKKLWAKALLFSTLSFTFLFIFQKNLATWVKDPASLQSIDLLVKSWSNLAFTLVLVSGFTLLFYHNSIRVLLNFFSPMGRMSLTNYIMQSVAGAYLYYGFGLGLYKHTGATYSLLIGISLTLIFVFFCRYWAKNHRHGPLEGLWHKATWLGKDKTT